MNYFEQDPSDTLDVYLIIILIVLVCTVVFIKTKNKQSVQVCQNKESRKCIDEETMTRLKEIMSLKDELQTKREQLFAEHFKNEGNIEGDASPVITNPSRVRKFNQELRLIEEEMTNADADLQELRDKSLLRELGVSDFNPNPK